MTFTEAVRACLTAKYATFSGRARPSEYWWFALALVLASTAAAVIDTFALGFGAGIGPLEALLTVATFIPGLAVTVRRLHDTGRSAWWLLLMLVIIIGWVVLVVFMVFDSDSGDNRYGPNPRWSAAT